MMFGKMLKKFLWNIINKLSASSHWRGGFLLYSNSSFFKGGARRAEDFEFRKSLGLRPPLTEAVHFSHFDYKMFKVLRSRNTTSHPFSKGE